MFINKAKNGKNNISRTVVEKRRQKMGKSQRQLAGLDIDKSAVQRIEAGRRLVTDIVLCYLAKVLDLTYRDLLEHTAGNA